MKTLTKMATVLAIFSGLTLASEAGAQNPRKKNVIKLGEFKIEGTIQKPQAFYILQRSSLNFEGLELKNSFVPKILRSVEQAPF